VTASDGVTDALQGFANGDPDGRERLILLVYTELRRMAARHLRRERGEHTLQPTALVHEAYLRMVGQTEAHWHNRTQFFAVAAQTMRRVLVDHARARAAKKRGGDAVRVALDPLPEEGPPVPETSVPPRDVDLIDLDDALRELGRIDRDLVEVVELRYFGGLTVEETAEALGVSPATVKRSWVTARAWLFRRLAPRRP
jgi:RNA polymerase sigma factor (TIGR02999 family)